MPQITIASFDGSVRVVAAESDQSLMQIIRDHDFDEMLALCGGCLSCATCHVHVDPAFFARLEPMTEMEDGLLIGSPYRTKFSRLSCQIKVTQVMEGMKVTVVPEN